MLINTNWLQKWVTFDLNEVELTRALTMAGLEVNSVNTVPQCDPNIVVGMVKEIQPHPSRDKLTICMVDVGDGDQLQIVCGAPDVTVGEKYPTALAGSQVGEITITERKVYGELSQGMLCSAGELELSDSFETLMQLDSSAEIGSSINKHLELPDSVLVLELTPNRADCLSVRGVARDVAVIFQKQKITTDIQQVPDESSSIVEVTVESPEDCPNYCGRVIEDIDPNAVTPDWMKMHLQRVGLRAIHPIVDITNYVMMELGQPMHAFDTELFDASEIIVRRSKAGEKLELLDGEQLDLGDDILLITDRDGPNGLAGVMGGQSSGIRPETRNIFLEAAFFTPKAIRRSVSRFNKHTDASHRFERGVDPLKQAEAMERATELIKEIAGGIPGPLIETTHLDYVPVKQACKVRSSRIERILGVAIPDAEIASMLESVNSSIDKVDDGWLVTPPTYRFDLEKEHDQIEEVARIYGYDRIPSTLTTSVIQSNGTKFSETDVKESSIRDLMHHHGYFEAITYSFVDPELQSKFKTGISPKPLANPLSENLSVMRTSLWPGLLSAFLENYRRNKDQIRLYEIGRVFHADIETDMIAGLCWGMSAPKQWGMEDRAIDFFDLKGDLLALLEITGQSENVEFRSEPYDGLHPGCSAGVYIADRRCGIIGQIHPEIVNEIKDESKVFVYELELDALLHRKLNQYQGISKFPPLLRDISLTVPAETPEVEISREIENCDQENLESFALFDVYCGDGIDSGSKSVAYRLTFRSYNQTLTDDEVNSSLELILDRLNGRFGAQLRKQAV